MGKSRPIRSLRLIVNGDISNCFAAENTEKLFPVELVK